MELELFSIIYDFLQLLTPEGFENCNKVLSYIIVVLAVYKIIDLFFDLFRLKKRD